MPVPHRSRRRTADPRLARGSSSGFRSLAEPEPPDEVQTVPREVPNRCSSEPETLAIDEPRGRRWRLWSRVIVPQRSRCASTFVSRSTSGPLPSSASRCAVGQHNISHHGRPGRVLIIAEELELTHTIRKHLSIVAPPLRSTLFATGTFCPIDVHRRPRTTQGGPTEVGTRSYGRASTRAPAHRTGPPVGGSSRDAAAARGRTLSCAGSGSRAAGGGASNQELLVISISALGLVSGHKRRPVRP